ncbi:MAG: hypothetical protein RLO17_24730 [Cyclobacteriaceae bacterium]|jgi:PRTRC genetic system protein B|tara:strand:+ start:963 stop:1706 length:744 start_codon:yes stop_codon:yes gene_type:complete
MFTDTLNARYIPKIALVVYKKKKDDNPFVENEKIPDFHLESCDFIETDGIYHLSAGRLLQENQLNQLARFLSKREQKRLAPFSFKRLIPSNILYAKQDQDIPTIVWIKVNVQEKLLFTKELGIPDGVCKLPNLLFYLSGSSMKVFAFKSNHLRENTPLYRAPFHNTDDTGVCMGNVKIKSKTRFWEDLIEAAEGAFFNSLFSHINGSSPLLDGYNLNTVLTSCIEKEDPFPIDSLAACKVTLKTLIK